MLVEQIGDFIKLQNTLIRIAKIDSVKTRHIVKPNNFGKVSDESFPEIIISIGADKYVFVYDTEASQLQALQQIEVIIAGKNQLQ